MNTRILQCLDLCEASGLFCAGDIDANRQAIAHGLFLRPLPVKPSHPPVQLALHRDGTLIEVAGSRTVLSSEALAFAATLSRVATLARECDRVMGGGE